MLREICTRTHAGRLSPQTRTTYRHGKRFLLLHLTLSRIRDSSRSSDGTVCAFYRVGRSGDGAYYMSTFDDATKTFINETKSLMQRTRTRMNSALSDDNDRLHLLGYRQSAGNADKLRMFYGVPADKGQTFTSAAGAASFVLPMTESNSERVANIAQSSGYVNQCGSALTSKTGSRPSYGSIRQTVALRLCVSAGRVRAGPRYSH